MTEKLLQFIWQFQYLNRQELKTTTGEPVQVRHPGQLNTHQGPDFFNGRIIIGQTEWAGHIELHLKSSDWFRHRHQEDPRYGRVILHVVWRHDAEVTDENGHPVPVLALEGRVSHLLLHRYEQWMNNPQLIPCAAMLPQVSDLVWQSWLDRLLAERLLEKCHLVAQQVQQTATHWEEVCWRMVCTYFGGPVNKESFLQIATSLPLTLLTKHRQVLPQLEALLLGQAGLLHKHLKDDYPAMLYREYQFLQKKYGLQVINKPPVFLRMRPPDFPTIRLSQLASILHRQPKWFDFMVEQEEMATVSRLFDATANDYWNTHFKPDVPTPHAPKTTGTNLMQRVMINAVIPVLFSYGHHHMHDAVRNKALRWLESMPPEANTHTRSFAALGRKAKNAAESQAIITLKTQYCHAKRCLSCAVGNTLLGQKGATTDS